MKATVPLGRYGNEGELDSTALYLASEASSYVTGAIIPVDGGYTCV
jgi:gluconate 5-dehydrogenase